MTLGIMQPYFFPYLGYFSLIKHCDQWISFDSVQYIERGWVNRNRIIHPNKPESMYIIVPLKKHHQKSNINEVLIDSEKPYVSKLIGQLTASYKKCAPFFPQVMELVEYCLNSESIMLSRLNEICVRKVCEYIGIVTEISVFSQMKLEIEPAHKSGDLVLRISKALKADRYINAIGGMELYDNAEFESSNIDLMFMKTHFEPYNQRRQLFLECLSIIDVMMFNDPAQIRYMLDHYELVSNGKS